MSEILKVLNRKVELKSEVVELGKVDDFSKSISLMKKSNDDFKKAIKEANSILKNVSNIDASFNGFNSLSSKSLKIDSAANKIYFSLKKTLKELGLKESDIKEIKEFEDILSDNTMKVLELSDIQDSIRKAVK